MKTIIIAGGTGFLGQVLEQYLSKQDYAIKILTRKPTKDNHIYWDGSTLGKWTIALEQSEALINLAGKSVDCRYNTKNKKLIYESRIQSTTILGKAVQSCKHPPKVWLNSSTATIYESSLNQQMTEDEGLIGNDFSMNIAKSWETAFNEFKLKKTQKAILRTSIVLGKTGGAFVPLKQLTKFCLGGTQGKGNQMVSWIHELDFARAVLFLIEQNHSGVFNIVSPQPVNNKNFMKTLRKSMGIPFGLSQPEWLLEIGARLINTETELILKSRNVIPEKLSQLGFHFKFENLEEALIELLNSKS